MAHRGVNFGKLSIGNDELSLVSMNDRQILSVPFCDMNNVSINKNDIIIQNTADQVGNDDCLCEIRFYVDQPKQDNSGDDKDADEEKSHQQRNVGNASKQQKESYASKTYKQILQKAKIGEFAGESIATLMDVNLAVPRGKYTIDFYRKNFRLHGASYSYNIDYKHIMKGFILPMKTQGQFSIVLQLNKDKPLFQGQTVYRYIVIQVKKDLQIQLKSKMNPQITQESPHLKDIKPEYNGYLFQVFVDLIQVFSKINIISPGNNFRSRDGQSCVKCNVKAQPGWLYMLKQSLIFISKPVIYFKIDQIRNIEFTRTSAANKQFDMKVMLKDDKKGVQFMGIERPELEALLEYFKERSVKVQTEAQQVTSKSAAIQQALGMQDEDSEEDEDFDGEGAEDSDDQSGSDDSFSGQASVQKSESKKNKKQE